MSHQKFPKRKIILLFSLLAVLVIITGLFIWGVLSGWIRPFAAGGQIQNIASYSLTDTSGKQVLGQSNTVTIQIISAPNAPSNLTATVISSTQINLTWTDNSSDETSFKIERSLSSSSGFTQIGTTASNVVAYTDSGLTPNTTYYYRIRASNSSGDSAYSNVAKAITLDTVPAAPTNLVAIASADRQIDLSWQDNSNNETGFKVERSLSISGFTQIAITAANSNTYLDTNLIAGTTYYYQVRAANIVGDSDYSNIASAAAITTPNPPSNLSATADATLNLIHLAWIDNSSDETGFELQRMVDGTATWTTVANPAIKNSTNYDDNTVQINILYWYQIRAINVIGNSVWSNMVSVKIIRDSQPPIAPANLAGTAVSYSEIDLTWTASTDNVGVVGYYIYRNSLKVGSTAGIVSYIDSNLFGSTTYTYYVTAFDAAGNESAASNSVTVTTPAPPDNPPTVSLTTPAEGTTVSGIVSVTASAADDVGVSRVDFYLDGIVASTDTVTPYSWSWDTTSYNNGIHTLMTRAYDTVGQYSSDTHTITVNNQIPTVQITNVDVSATATTATFRWTTNIAASSQVCYGISRPDEICTPVDQNLVTTHSVTVLGLAKKTGYQYQILSNLGGTGAGNARYTGKFRTRPK